LKRGLAASARGTALGFPFGLIPGMLPAVTTFLAYDVEKRISKTPERFGKGAIEGVAAPEAANNATAMGGFVPLLSLGIPTGPSLAILLAAFMSFGLTPGPQLFNTNGLLVWTVIASMLIANIMLLVLNLPLVRMWAMISRVPYSALAPIILAVSLVGAFSSRNAMMDVITAVVFGFVGLAMKRAGVPPAPLVLGLLLGPLLEQSLRQSLSVSAGSPAIFFSHPIALALILVAAIFLAVSLYLKVRKPKGERLLETAAGDAWDS
jgi:putative tricarboxylic transport membrane protein